MLRRTTSRTTQIPRRNATLQPAAAGYELGPIPLMLELPLEAHARYADAAKSAPAEKAAGSCVIVIDMGGDDESDAE